MRSQRPGRKVFKNPGASFGVKVIEPGFPSAAGGWWNDFGAIACCIAAYQARAAASLAASYIDLSGNGNNCGPGVAPGWNAVQGWIFNGVNQWLDTVTLIPAVDQSWSCLMQFANAAAVPQWAFGIRADGGGRIFGIQPNNAGIIVTYYNGGVTNAAPGLAAGNLGFAGNQGYRNGAADGGPIGVWTGGNGGLSIYLGCINRGGVAQRFQAHDMYAISFYNCVLTAPQMAAVAAWMAAI